MYIDLLNKVTCIKYHMCLINHDHSRHDSSWFLLTVSYLASSQNKNQYHKSTLYVHLCPSSSPPLLEVRERVRINGVPVSRALFGRYGVECLELLEKNKTKFGQEFSSGIGPFPIFTLVAYYILVKEKVRPLSKLISTQSLSVLCFYCYECYDFNYGMHYCSSECCITKTIYGS